MFNKELWGEGMETLTLMDTANITGWVQVSGDVGDPFQYGGYWLELRDGKPTGGWCEWAGLDAGFELPGCYVNYKHVSVSNNIKRREGFRSQEWCDKWLKDNDVDCLGDR